MDKLTGPGQIKPGAKIVVTYRGERLNYTAEKILNPGHERLEEIILAVDTNLYFITSMAADGTSWAKDVEYQNIHRCFEGGDGSACDCPDHGRSVVDYAGE